MRTATGRQPGELLLDVEGLRVRDGRGRERVRGVDLQLRAGEVVGVAGVAGNGQDELVEALVGLLGAQAGTVRVWPAPRSRARTWPRGGAAGSPTSRPTAAATACRSTSSLLDNAVAGGASHRRRVALGLVPAGRAGSGPRAARSSSATACARAASTRRPTALSGGNQQRLVLGRELDGEPARADRRPADAGRRRPRRGASSASSCWHCATRGGARAAGLRGARRAGRRLATASSCSPAARWPARCAGPIDDYAELGPADDVGPGRLMAVADVPAPAAPGRRRALRHGGQALVPLAAALVVGAIVLAAHRLGPAVGLPAAGARGVRLLGRIAATLGRRHPAALHRARHRDRVPRGRLQHRRRGLLRARRARRSMAGRRPHRPAGLAADPRRWLAGGAGRRRAVVGAARDAAGAARRRRGRDDADAQLRRARSRRPGSSTAFLLAQGTANSASPLIARQPNCPAIGGGTLDARACPIALAAVAAVRRSWMRGSAAGFELRMTGSTRAFAHSTGISVPARDRAGDGLVGRWSPASAARVHALGVVHRFVDGFSPGYGFTGIAIALLARNGAIGHRARRRSCSARSPRRGRRSSSSRTSRSTSSTSCRARS